MFIVCIYCNFSILFNCQWLFWFFGVRDFLPSSFVTRSLGRYVCEDDLGSEWCSNLMFVMCGYDKAQLNEVYYCLFVYQNIASPAAKYATKARMMKNKDNDLAFRY